jgi:hypothetical protein
VKNCGLLFALLTTLFSEAVFAEEKGVLSSQEARVFQNCCVALKKGEERPQLFGDLKSSRMFNWKKRTILLHATNDGGVREEWKIKQKSRFIGIEYAMDGKNFL